MTLGELIERLEKEDPTKVILNGFGEPMSYRGYYDELAFEPMRNVTIGSMLMYARSAVGRTFEGYKGGDFKMKTYTDVWLAVYGSCGEMLGNRLLEYMLNEENKDE